MKICIVGAGAIGSFIGARVAAAGNAEVSALARGETLQALREHGWRLQLGENLLQAPVTAANDAAELGEQDLVVIAVKGPALTEVVPSIAPLLGDKTAVMPAMNGVPWWFVQGVDGMGSIHLESVDPGGVIDAAIPQQSILGAVVHAAASRVEPGLIQHKMGQGIILGEAAGGTSDRAQAVADLLSEAGFEVTHSNDVRQDIWYKLWGNMTMNPVSAITGATADRLLADPLVRKFCSDAMHEANEIGKRIGCPIDQDPEDRHAITAKLGAFKTSMLQDAEAGNAIELDAIVGAAQELGRILAIKTPNIDALLGLTRLFARTRGLYPE